MQSFRLIKVKIIYTLLTRAVDHQTAISNELAETPVNTLYHDGLLFKHALMGVVISLLQSL